MENEPPVRISNYGQERLHHALHLAERLSLRAQEVSDPDLANELQMAANELRAMHAFISSGS